MNYEVIYLDCSNQYTICIINIQSCLIFFNVHIIPKSLITTSVLLSWQLLQIIRSLKLFMTGI